MKSSVYIQACKAFSMTTDKNPAMVYVGSGGIDCRGNDKYFIWSSIYKSGKVGKFVEHAEHYLNNKRKVAIVKQEYLFFTN